MRGRSKTGIVVLVLALTAWFVIEPWTDPPPAAQSPLGAVAFSGDGAPSRASLEGDASARLVGSTNCAVLEVEVDDQGRAGSGTISIVQLPTPQGLLDGLAEGTAVKDEDDVEAAHHVLANGKVVIDLRAGEWTWLRLRTRGGNCVFDLLAPFGGRLEHKIRLPRRPRIHVQVLGEDWRTPIRHARFQVLYGALSAPSLLAPVEVTCDVSGYARLDEVPDGRAILVASGATPTEGSPHVCALVVHSGQGDVRAVLVQPGARVPVTLNVWADLGGWVGPGPKLFLEQMEGQREPLKPQAGLLVDGRQELRFEMPRGVYRLRALPTGSLKIGGAERIDVEAQAVVASATIVRNPDETRLRLRGLASHDFPIRVTAVAVDGIRNEDVEHEFLGRFHWHSPELMVPQLGAPRVLHVFGRQRVFVSRPVEWSGPTAEVDLYPASKVDVYWTGSVLIEDDEPLLLVRRGGQEHLCGFVRQLVHGRGARRPGFVATTVIEQGAVELSGQIGSSFSWSRSVRLERGYHRVRI